MSIEAMKLALETLEFFWNSGYRNIAPEQTAAMDALRQAIEQAEQAPICAHGVGKNKCDFCKQAEQAPLTDEMLLYIYNQLPSWDMDMDKLPRSLREFARAIEAAHGIKENT